ncbi:hypothetical protein [Microvirga soli]|uniref:hypothetical protein n=1 Tax=Microvirga soli TaxID=1854496 RepID=UPI00191D1631|nr:hypothetical protein [Microvirga soli]
MIYLYWLGAFIVVTPVILGLPLLSRNRTYRIATLFAGMHVGIVILYFFIYALKWDRGSTYLDELHIFFTTTIPLFYIASLIIGSTIIARYYLTASTRAGSVFAGIGSLIGVYVLSIVVGATVEIMSLTLKEGLPSSETLWTFIDNTILKLRYPNLSIMGIIFLSAFLAMNGTDAAMRISDKSGSSKTEEAE